jgi:hypothetical protein
VLVQNALLLKSSSKKMYYLISTVRWTQEGGSEQWKKIHPHNETEILQNFIHYIFHYFLSAAFPASPVLSPILCFIIY